MSIDTIAVIATSIFCALVGAAATAITLVAGVKTDVNWLKSRLVEISRQIDRLDHPNQRHDN